MRGLLVGLMLVGSAALAVPAARGGQGQDFSKVEIKATKVAGNIYMLQGAGGNIAASIGDDGIVIVDDQFAPLAEKIQASLKSLGITDKPVRFVIYPLPRGSHGRERTFQQCGLDGDCAGQRAEEAGKRRDGGEWRNDSHGE